MPANGNDVWIGVNATIVGKVSIGDDVLIAPNAFVNCDIPSHSVVFGNPCIIKYRDNATEGYINKWESIRRELDWRFDYKEHQKYINSVDNAIA